MSDLNGVQQAAYGAYTAAAGNRASQTGVSGFSARAAEGVGASGSPVDGAGASGMAGSKVAGKAGGPQGAGAAQAAECATCANRSYQDVSNDAGVSFKAPGKIDPSSSAAVVMAHEQEHVSIAQARANENGGRIVASVTLKTAICPECGTVYVAGGEARITTITPGENSDEASAEAGGSGAKGMSSAGSSAGRPPMVMEDGGADRFRNMYKKSMAAHFGLFMNARA